MRDRFNGRKTQKKKDHITSFIRGVISSEKRCVRKAEEGRVCLIHPGMNDAPSLDFIQYIVKYMNKFDDDANDASHGETKDGGRPRDKDGDDDDIVVRLPLHELSRTSPASASRYAFPTVREVHTQFVNSNVLKTAHLFNRIF